MCKYLENTAMHLIRINFDDKVLSRRKLLDIFAKDRRFNKTQVREILIVAKSRGYIINA